MTTALLILMVVDILITVIFARRTEAATKDASEISRQIMQGLLEQADHEPMARRRHL